MKYRASAFALACALVAPVCATAEIHITEIMFDPERADAKREWIELYNAGTDAVDLTTHTFVDKSNHSLNVPPKNGGTASMMLHPGTYVVLASDATTFLNEYPGTSVIDTTMNLNNTGAAISLKSGTAVIDSALYAKGQGATGTGDSLQLNGNTWIHAKPTPGAANATTPSVVIKKTTKTAVTPKPKASTKKIVSVARAEAAENDPLGVVNAEATATPSQTAATGALEGSVWWLAAAALALFSAAVASVISNGKKQEWDIEESE